MADLDNIVMSGASIVWTPTATETPVYLGYTAQDTVVRKTIETFDVKDLAQRIGVVKRFKTDEGYEAEFLIAEASHTNLAIAWDDTPSTVTTTNYVKGGGSKALSEGILEIYCMGPYDDTLEDYTLRVIKFLNATLVEAAEYAANRQSGPTYLRVKFAAIMDTTQTEGEMAIEVSDDTTAAYTLTSGLAGS